MKNRSPIDLFIALPHVPPRSLAMHYSMLREDVDVDGWTARSARLVIPPWQGAEAIELLLEFPGWAGRATLELGITANGSTVGRFRLSPGYAYLRIAFPASVQQLDVRFHADADFELPGQARRRTWRLLRVRYVTNAFKLGELSPVDLASETGDVSSLRRVLLVVGPSCAGKTHFMQRFESEQFRSDRQQLGFCEPSLWVLERELTTAAAVGTGRIDPNAWKPILDDVSAQNRTLVTLLTPARDLKARMQNRVLDGSDPYLAERRNILVRYHNAEWVRTLYAQWFSFCNSEAIKNHWVVCGVGDDSMPKPFESFETVLPLIEGLRLGTKFAE